MAGVRIATSLSSTVKLNDDVVMPMYGYGTYKMSDDVTCAEVLHAIKTGHRLIDTAQFYNNEKGVGMAVKQCGLPREDIFVVSKVWTTNTGRENCIASVNESLKELDLPYVDLFLMHAPCSNGKTVETYKALLELKEKGVVQSVGVSNFGIAHIEGLKSAGCPLPSVNQIELNVFYRQSDIVDHCRKNNIAVMGYSPLAKAQKGFKHEKLTAIATKHNKTVAQVMIRWSVQMGFITIPKTAKTERIDENANIFDFALDDQDLAAINSLPESSCTWTPQLDRWLG